MKKWPENNKDIGCISLSWWRLVPITIHGNTARGSRAWDSMPFRGSRFTRRATIYVDAIRVENGAVQSAFMGAWRRMEGHPCNPKCFLRLWNVIMNPFWPQNSRKPRGSYAEAESSLARSQHTRLGTSGCLTILLPARFLHNMDVLRLN